MHAAILMHNPLISLESPLIFFSGYTRKYQSLYALVNFHWSSTLVGTPVPELIQAITQSANHEPSAPAWCRVNVSKC